MGPAGITKVMQAVATPKGTMAMEVVDVSSLKPSKFHTFFSSKFLSDGAQDQGSQGQGQGQGQQTGCTSIFFLILLYLIYNPTNPAGGFMSKAKGMLHDLKDGGNRGSGGEYSQPGNQENF